MTVDEISPITSSYYQEIKEKYQERGKYFHETIINMHIIELHDKFHKYLSNDQKAMNQNDFLKELADLKILLNMYEDIYDHFKNMVDKRIFKFYSKVVDKK